MKYSKEGLYIEELKDGQVKIGLSDKGQDDVGDIVYADIKLKDQVQEGDYLIGLEGGKAVTDISSPISGQVVEVNKAVLDQPSLLDSTDHDKNWIVILENVDAVQVASLDDESGFVPE